MKFLPILPILTRYPFLKISISFLREAGIDSVERLRSNLRKFPEVIEEAKEIVLAAIEGRKYPRKIDESDIICVSCEDRKCSDCREIGDFSGCNLCLECFTGCSFDYPHTMYHELMTLAKISILRYIASRMIVSGVEDWVRMRYAVNEANYYAGILNMDSDAVLKIVAKDLGIITKGWKVHVSSYVVTSSRLRAEEWRLVNRRLVAGYVDTTRKELTRIVEEFLRGRLFEKPVFDISEFEDILGNTLREVKNRVSRETKFEVELGEVDIRCFPPCMMEILSELQRGMNVPHTARFALTSFLINIGMSIDEVVDLFKSAPDFDEEKTRYQVEHIAGSRGKGVEYTSPSCDTMRTYHNCVAQCDVRHPLIFYARCKKGGKERKRMRSNI
jgi:DNA primase large subunit